VVNFDSGSNSLPDRVLNGIARRLKAGRKSVSVLGEEESSGLFASCGLCQRPGIAFTRPPALTGTTSIPKGKKILPPLELPFHTMLVGTFQKLEYRCPVCSHQGYISEVFTQGNTIVLRGACHRCGRARGVRVMDLDEDKGLSETSTTRTWVKMRFELLT
jgi:hypothetical protein